jgi:hypothetical protein
MTKVTTKNLTENKMNEPKTRQSRMVSTYVQKALLSHITNPVPVSFHETISSQLGSSTKENSFLTNRATSSRKEVSPFLLLTVLPSAEELDKSFEQTSSFSWFPTNIANYQMSRMSFVYIETILQRNSFQLPAKRNRISNVSSRGCSFSS